MSSEIIPKENIIYKVRPILTQMVTERIDGFDGFDCLNDALSALFAKKEPSYWLREKIYTLDQLSRFVKDNITMHVKDLQELPWDRVRSESPCFCFGCRLSRRVSGWFRGRK